MNNLTYIVREEFDLYENYLGLFEYLTTKFKAISNNDILSIISLYTDTIVSEVLYYYPEVCTSKNVNYISSCIDIAIENMDGDNLYDEYYSVLFEIAELDGDLMTCLNEISIISPFASTYYKIENGELKTCFDPDELLIIIYVDLINLICLLLRDKIKLIIMSIIGGLKFNLNSVITNKSISYLPYPNELILVYTTS